MYYVFNRNRQDFRVVAAGITHFIKYRNFIRLLTILSYYESLSPKQIFKLQRSGCDVFFILSLVWPWYQKGYTAPQKCMLFTLYADAFFFAY